MADQVDDLDDVRHQHHLRHRSREDQRLAQLIWLAIFTAIAARSIQRTYSWWRLRCLRKHRTTRVQFASTPSFLDKTAAFFTAVSLLSIPRVFGATISTLPLGKILSLVAFTCSIGSLIVSVDAPRFSDHFVDDVAFRAAWITLAQVPLVYLLATKRGPLNIMAALSYERINWIHRWTGRILFLSATTHMGIMMRSIEVSDILESPDKIMIIVRYGVGAYGLLMWIALSSVLPMRRWSYRMFYINHWISTSVFLWVLFKHVPKYARTPIYMSTAIILIDRCLTYYTLFRNNICIRTVKRRFSKFRKGPSRKAITMGHPVKMTAPVLSFPNPLTAESTTIIRICDVPFSWKPGQHIRLYLPKLGGFEVHPFTPATCSQAALSPTSPNKSSDVENDRLLSPSLPPDSTLTNEMVLMIRAHSGLTEALAQYHSRWLSRPCPNASRPSSSLTAFVDGPYGTPPAWETFPTLVLVSTSTGVSFPLSIMDYLEQICAEDPARLRTQRIRFIWSVRHFEPQFDANVIEMLGRCTTMLREAGVKVEADIYATCPKTEVLKAAPQVLQYDPFAHLRPQTKRTISGKPLLRIFNPDRPFEEQEEELAKLEELYLEETGSDASDTDSCGSYESDGDDSDTLIDEEEEEGIPEGSFWSQFESPLFNGGRRSSSPRPKITVVDSQTCSCALVQSQLQRSRSTKSNPEFITRFYGSRTNVAEILKAAAPVTEKETVMVAVCSNQDVVAQARNKVAKMNFEFVSGRREARVEIFSECFS